jgi:hypothetical protein
MKIEELKKHLIDGEQKEKIDKIKLYKLDDFIRWINEGKSSLEIAELLGKPVNRVEEAIKNAKLEPKNYAKFNRNVILSSGMINDEPERRAFSKGLSKRDIRIFLNEMLNEFNLGRASRIINKSDGVVRGEWNKIKYCYNKMKYRESNGKDIYGGEYIPYFEIMEKIREENKDNPKVNKDELLYNIKK